MGTTLANAAEEALVAEAERSPATHHAGRAARRCALEELSSSGFSYTWRHWQRGAALLHGLFSHLTRCTQRHIWGVQQYSLLCSLLPWEWAASVQRPLVLPPRTRAVGKGRVFLEQTTR